VKLFYAFLIVATLSSARVEAGQPPSRAPPTNQSPAGTTKMNSIDPWEFRESEGEGILAYFYGSQYLMFGCDPRKREIYAVFNLKKPAVDPRLMESVIIYTDNANFLIRMSTSYLSNEDVNNYNVLYASSSLPSTAGMISLWRALPEANTLSIKVSWRNSPMELSMQGFHAAKTKMYRFCGVNFGA